MRELKNNKLCADASAAADGRSTEWRKIEDGSL